MSDDRHPDATGSGEPPLEPATTTKRGPLAWFARNSVVANMVLLVLLFGGLFKASDVKQEVFPEFNLDLVLVNVPYPGASPSEVESGILLAVEEAVRSVDGVREVRTTATEGMGVAVVELMFGTDAQEALDDVKSAIDRIASFPENAEQPIVFRAKNRVQVISLVIYGDQSEQTLRSLAERTRDELLQLPNITTVDLHAVRPYEISIEIPQEDLRRYGLTLDQVASIIRQSSIELPGGAIKGAGGEILVRTDARRDRGSEYEDIIVVSRPDGSTVRLSDIASIDDGFAETDLSATFNGQRAVMVNVYRIGDQKPTEVADAVKAYVAEQKETLPEGVGIATWFDGSEFLRGRIDLLTTNAMVGLILVLLILGLFLEVKLAFWVTLGIPASFLGAMLFLPMFDVSINMLSLFAFILVLGMVVDDAIIVGEAIYAKRQEGLDRVTAAIYGVKQMAVPVTFAILTTILAYMPMLFVPGNSGKFFRQIPIVVIATLIMSLVEALIILPAHLAHSRQSRLGIFAWIDRQQNKVSRFLERFINHRYAPFARMAVKRRYLTFAVGFAMLLSTCGYVAGGHIEFSFMPKIENDVLVARADLPYGTSVEQTKEVQKRIVDVANELIAENGGDEIVRGVFSEVGAAGIMMMGPAGVNLDTGGHITETAVYMVPIDERDITGTEFVRQWRERLGEIPGVDKLIFQFETATMGGKPVAIQLSHNRPEILEQAARTLAERLRPFKGVYGIDSGVTAGKPQIDLELKPEARALGLTEMDLAMQLRSAYFGAEAVRQQRGRDEVRTYVRLPEDERSSEYGFEQLIIRTPSGGEMPLAQAAWIDRGYSYTSINRIDGRRTITVTADVDQSLTNANQVNQDVAIDLMPEVMAEYPGLTWSFGGEQKEQTEIMGALGRNGLMAIMAIFAVLAIVFRSYIQPIIILSTIPFGFIGAVGGHVLFGYELSLMSMFGVVALAGVAVNDSLVYIDAANQGRRQGMSPLDAAIYAGTVRFRPILLTSLTTFGGLMPMLLETSLQARFLIPMAISLGFGVLAATVSTLVIVPSLYLIVDDIHRGIMWVAGRDTSTTSQAKQPIETESG